MEFKYVPLPAQHLGMCNIRNVYKKNVLCPMDRSFFMKRNRLTHITPKTHGPSKSQTYTGRTKQMSQFTMRKCWAGSGTYLNFIK